MRIHSYRCWLQKIKLRQPYTIAYDSFDHTEIVFLEIILENGMKALGASNPFEEVIGETPSQTLSNLQSGFLDGLFRNADIRQIDSLLQMATEHYADFPGTLAAIDIALHDAWGQFLEKPLVEIWGVRSGPLITSMTIGIKDVTEMLKDAAEYAKQGFRSLKIKTGRDVREDIERVQALHKDFHQTLRLRVDANEGYTLDDLKLFLDQTKNIPLELIEQPLPPDLDSVLLTIKDRHVKLAADESLINEESAKILAAAPKRYDIFNVKLMKCGGIAKAQKIVSIAENTDIELFWGCNDESAVSLTAALHVAYSTAQTKYLDLDGSFDLVTDVIKRGFILKDGALHITGKNGLGLEY